MSSGGEGMEGDTHEKRCVQYDFVLREVVVFELFQDVVNEVFPLIVSLMRLFGFSTLIQNWGDSKRHTA